jgi:hypothetical protein
MQKMGGVYIGRGAGPLSAAPATAHAPPPSHTHTCIPLCRCDVQVELLHTHGEEDASTAPLLLNTCPLTCVHATPFECAGVKAKGAG